jgi:hypothetical protein
MGDGGSAKVGSGVDVDGRFGSVAQRSRLPSARSRSWYRSRGVIVEQRWENRFVDLASGGEQQSTVRRESEPAEEVGGQFVAIELLLNRLRRDGHRSDGW